jgi:hypothetical protein
MVKNEKMEQLMKFLVSEKEVYEDIEKKAIQEELDEGKCLVSTSISRCMCFGIYILVDMLLKMINNNKIVTKRFLRSEMSKFQKRVGKFVGIEGFRTKGRLELENNGKIILIKKILEKYYLPKKREVTLLKEKLIKKRSIIENELSYIKKRLSDLEDDCGIVINGRMVECKNRNCYNIPIFCNRCVYYTDFIELSDRAKECEFKINEIDSRLYDEIEKLKLIKVIEKKVKLLKKELGIVKKDLQKYLDENNIKYKNHAILCDTPNKICLNIKIVCEEKKCKLIIPIITLEKEIFGILEKIRIGQKEMFILKNTNLKGVNWRNVRNMEEC